MKNIIESQFEKKLVEDVLKENKRDEEYGFYIRTELYKKAEEYYVNKYKDIPQGPGLGAYAIYIEKDNNIVEINISTWLEGIFFRMLYLEKDRKPGESLKIYTREEEIPEIDSYIRAKNLHNEMLREAKYGGR